MKIVVAPDSFKECLSAREVAETIAVSIRQRLPDAEVVEMPLADGGEGTVDVLTAALGGDFRTVCVRGPLGRPVCAKYGVAGDMAIVEVAQACGLALLSPEERNPLAASSSGLGELLLDAFGNGCRRFVMGLGGTATCDGGAGMLSVPGVREMRGKVSVEILCDVDAPFIGPRGAVRVFAPQKGASPEDVEILEARMTTLAEQIFEETGVKVADLPGAGAAGGLGGAFVAYFGGKLVSGIEKVLALTGFEKAVEGADLIITGEGRSDLQTLMGKVPAGVLRHSHGVPVLLLSGRIEDAEVLEKAGFRGLFEVSPRSMPLDEALHPDVARKNLSVATHRYSSFLGIFKPGT